MNVTYQKLKVYDTHVEKEFCFKSKNKEVVKLWIKLTEDKEYEHSKLLAEDLDKDNKIENKNNDKEIIDNAIDNLYEKIICNYPNIYKLFINVGYAPERNLNNFLNCKAKKFSCRIQQYIFVI